MSLSPGVVLQRRYRVLRPLGSGGMATAWEVDDRLRGNRLALKVVRLGDERLRRMFCEEFARLCGLYHPHLARVHDLGSDVVGGARLWFYTSDLVEGETLDRHAAGRPFAEVVRPLGDALTALAFLHEVGIRHGDFKPDNVLVGGDGRGVLIDLGCARAIDAPPDDAVCGTAGFLAPELLAGGRAMAAADLYAVGVTLKQLAAGSDAPRAIARLAARLASADPVARPSAAEVIEALGGKGARPGPPRGRAPRLLGREAEMSLFGELLDALASGRAGPRALILTGPRGIGRSRLLAEMKWAAQLRCGALEGVATAESPVGFLLRLFLNDPELPLDVLGVLAMRERLSASRAPAVLVIDDAQLLPEREAELLAALLRTLSPADPVLVLCATTTPLPVDSNTVRTLALGPLGESDVRAWAGSSIPTGRIPDLLRWTGGHPAYIEACLARLAEGELHEDEVAAGPPRLDAAPLALGDLGEEERRTLALLAVLDGRLTDEDRRALGVSDAALFALAHRAWVRVEGPFFRLARAADAGALLDALPPSLVTSLHAAVAATLAGTSPDPARQARRAYHLAAAGKLPDAERCVLDAEQARRESPAAWGRVAALLAGCTRQPEVQLAAAEILQAAGRGEESLRALARLLRRRPGAALAIRVRQLAAACYLRLGRPHRAMRQIREALKAKPPPDARAALVDTLARVLIQQGAYAEAHGLARAELADASGPARGLLHEVAGVAASYQGDPSARGHLVEAARLQKGAGDPRVEVRVLSYLAIHDFRGGRLPEAIAGYRAALAIAERHHLPDLVADAELNLGTACQLHGQWGPALDHYERALRIATALGKRGTELTLGFNVANLHALIGLGEWAEEAMLRVRADAARAGKSSLAAPCDLVLGEIALSLGRAEDARAWLARAAAAFAVQGATREQAEVELQLARVALLDGNPGEAASRIASARGFAGDDAATDLEAALIATEARLALSLGRGATALDPLERALGLAMKGGHRALEAEIAGLLAETAQSTGAGELAATYAATARAIWTRIGLSLPEARVDAFWRHPLRATPAPSATRSREPTREVRPRRHADLRRFLEVNKRLNSTLSTEQVLAYAMDAAIELTGAERGFVLLVPPGRSRRLEVAVARNLDRERVGRSHLKFSQGIAQKVIAAGEPILASDAAADDRFAAAPSVHAMRLRSIACIPIRSPDGVLGALYLDNRFERGLFEEADLERLLAFSDQVALALRNARLHAELQGRTLDLEARTRELEAEKRRVEELMQGQTEEIDRLQEQVRLRQAALELRYDYGHIVGRGAAMRRMLATVDRVVDSTANVLIEGESGTGKELVARAMHYNGPRRDRPFVSVNCGALPESLLESELFGHVRGAFSGADRDRPGLVVAAHGGTLFLDEIGEMPLAMQVKLLRVLQEREVRPVGATRASPVDVRLVCATNRRLLDEVSAGRFREDLYYRVAVVVVNVPPLRERPEDVVDLARHFVARLAEQAGRTPPRLGRDVLAALARYPWPGNVRQLENVLTRALAMTDRDRITLGDIELVEPRRELAKSRDDYDAREAERIVAALNESGWNVRAVSRRLGIPSNTLYRKLHRHGIVRPR